MKIDGNKNLLKNVVSIRAYWIEDNSEVVLHTTALQHDVCVMYIASDSTEAIVSFMQNVEKSLRTEVYFIVSNDIKPLTIAHVYFKLPTVAGGGDNKLIIVRFSDSIPEIERITI